MKYYSSKKKLNGKKKKTFDLRTTTFYSQLHQVLFFKKETIDLNTGTFYSHMQQLTLLAEQAQNVPSFMSRRGGHKITSRIQKLLVNVFQRAP